MREQLGRDEKGQYHLVPDYDIHHGVIGENDPVPSNPHRDTLGRMYVLRKEYIPGTDTPENLEIVQLQKALEEEKRKYTTLVIYLNSCFDAFSELKQLTGWIPRNMGEYDNE